MRKLGCEGQAGAKLNKRTESNTLGPWATVLRRNGDGLGMQGRGLADGALLRSFSTMALPHPPGGGDIWQCPETLLDCHTWGAAATGIQWVEVRDAAERSTRPRTASPQGIIQ